MTVGLLALLAGCAWLVLADRTRTRRLVRRHLRAAQECEDALRVLASGGRWLADARVDAWAARADRERLAAWNLRRKVR